MEHIDVGAASGLFLTARPVRPCEAAARGLLEPSGRPVIVQRELSQPFVGFEKRYWKTALRVDKQRQHVDPLLAADLLQVRCFRQVVRLCGSVTFKVFFAYYPGYLLKLHLQHFSKIKKSHKEVTKQ